jgi:type IX secretion system PorP/SprF family membrane protein
LKRLLIIALLLTGCLWTIDAQQLPLYSQYMMNRFLLNPAIAGSDGYTTFSLTAREQWLGFDQAPRTHALSFQTRLLKRSYIIKGRNIKNRRFKPGRSGRVGLGGYVFNDRNGLVNRTGLQFNYAYHIRFRESQLSFGLAGSMFQFNLLDEQINFWTDNDPLQYDGSTRRVLFVPDASFGVYYTTRNYYAGLSAAQLFQSFLKVGNNTFKDYRLLRHYYVTGGYIFDLENDFEIEPSILLKTDENWRFQLDVNTKVIYKSDLWVGLSYRTGSSIIAMGGFRVNQLYFGYAFDYTLASIMKYSYGSHEFMISLKLGDNARRFRWLERY